jgi:hypothetical protein
VIGGERCPTCKSREVDVIEYREISVTEHKTSNTGIVSAAGAGIGPMMSTKSRKRKRVVLLNSGYSSSDTESSLDKSRSANHDSLDALRLALSCMRSKSS